MLYLVYQGELDDWEGHWPSASNDLSLKCHLNENCEEPMHTSMLGVIPYPHSWGKICICKERSANVIALEQSRCGSGGRWISNHVLPTPMLGISWN